MVSMTDDPARPDITYPCRWEYRVIGTSHDLIEELIGCTVGERDHVTSEGMAKGKFVSMHVDVLVASEDERNWIYRELASPEFVKIVI